MNYLISGATGLVGFEIVNQLLETDLACTINILGRTNPFQNNPRVIFYPFDFKSDSFKLKEKMDTAFCALGTTLKKAGSKENQIEIDHHFVVRFARIAYENGCKQIGIVSSTGANAKSKNFYLRVKGEMERAIGSVGFESIQFIRPSFLLGKRKEFRFGEKVAAVLNTVIGPILIGKAKRWKGVNAEKVAATLIRETLKKEKGIHFIESENI